MRKIKLRCNRVLPNTRTHSKQTKKYFLRRGARRRVEKKPVMEDVPWCPQFSVLFNTIFQKLQYSLKQFLLRPLYQGRGEFTSGFLVTVRLKKISGSYQHADAFLANQMAEGTPIPTRDAISRKNSAYGYCTC